MPRKTGQTGMLFRYEIIFCSRYGSFCFRKIYGGRDPAENDTLQKKSPDYLLHSAGREKTD